MPMRRIANLRTQTKLFLLTGVFAAGFIAFGFTALMTISSVKVHGPHYLEIAQNKDLLADILPPPNFIVESYVETHLMPDVMGTPEFELAKGRFLKLKQDYLTRLDYWKANLPESNIKTNMMVESDKHAMEFYRLVEQHIIPNLEKGDRDAADEVLTGALAKAYKDHRAVIDSIVTDTIQHSTNVETKVANIVSRQTTMLLSIGVLLLTAVCGLTWWIRLSVIKQENAEQKLRKAEKIADVLVQVNSSALTLGTSADELSDISTRMAVSANETATQANLVSAASQQVSHNVMTVSTSVDEMNAAIYEIAKNASESARVARKAVEEAQAANTSIAKLGTSSAEIGKVIKVITTIAEQTNMLALNATIEAARAGEAGKGFAVVANEVKELAKETAKATGDISRKIEAIQTGTDGAVEAIRQIGVVINNISEISTSIASAVEEQTATTAEMTRNISEAARGSAEITQNIVSVAQSAQQTTKGAADCQHAAAELARMADALQQIGTNNAELVDNTLVSHTTDKTHLPVHNATQMTGAYQREETFIPAGKV